MDGGMVFIKKSNLITFIAPRRMVDYPDSRSWGPKVNARIGPISGNPGETGLSFP